MSLASICHKLPDIFEMFHVAFSLPLSIRLKSTSVMCFASKGFNYLVCLSFLQFPAP